MLLLQLAIGTQRCWLWLCEYGGSGGALQWSGIGPENGALVSSLFFLQPLALNTFELSVLRPHHSLATYMLSPCLWTGHQVCHLWCPLPSKAETGCPCTAESGPRCHQTPAQLQSSGLTPLAATLVSVPAQGSGSTQGRADQSAFVSLAPEHSLDGPRDARVGQCSVFPSTSVYQVPTAPQPRPDMASCAILELDFTIPLLVEGLSPNFTHS